MNARELMIGDIVMAHLEDEVKATDFPVVIVGLDENQTLVDGTCEFSWKPLFKEFNHIEFSDELNPIPLTPEISEKNGWKIGMYSRFNLEDGKWLDFYHHENRLRKWWEGIDEWQNHAKVKEINFQCHCTYVHELQHALRLCGLNDLADNFKI